MSGWDWKHERGKDMGNRVRGTVRRETDCALHLCPHSLIVTTLEDNKSVCLQYLSFFLPEYS
jgi:hypothetical protein